MTPRTLPRMTPSSTSPSGALRSQGGVHLSSQVQLDPSYQLSCGGVYSRSWDSTTGDVIFVDILCNKPANNYCQDPKPRNLLNLPCLEQRECWQAADLSVYQNTSHQLTADHLTQKTKRTSNITMGWTSYDASGLRISMGEEIRTPCCSSEDTRNN